MGAFWRWFLDFFYPIVRGDADAEPTARVR
jgi:hypothetical protein